MEHSAILWTVALAVGLGVVGQVLASLTRLPAIIFLLLLGILTGPSGLGVVRPAQLGGGLAVLTSAFVAIILFEGGLTLRPRVLREAIGPVRRLITVGAALTLVGAAVLARLVMGMAWAHALLFASLIVVTGPTVIAPILRRVRLRPRLAAVLKSESILIDPVGVLVAVVVLHAVSGLLTHGAAWDSLLLGFFARAGLGILVGVLLGGGGVLLGRLPFFHRAENEYLVLLGGLALVLCTFAGAEALYAESGIMAVTVAGLILAAAPLPFRDELEKFKDHLTTLGVSVLFILLAAGVDLELLRATGRQEVLLLAGLIFVVRPLSVFLATAGTTLDWRERAYLGLLAPRGIVAAATAAHFADYLRPHDARAADLVKALVFLTIAVTVCLQGGWAALLARLLRVQDERPQGVLLVGVNEWSLALADTLKRLGVAVGFLDNNPLKCAALRERGYLVHQGDAAERGTYEQLDLAEFGWLIALTPNDAINTLAADAAAGWLGREHVLQVLAKPVDAPSRSRVRMAGGWALPTRQAHQAVCTALQQRRLRVISRHCSAATTLTHEADLPDGLLVPLLVQQGAKVQVVREGTVCPAGATLIGLSGATTALAPTAA